MTKKKPLIFIVDDVPENIQIAISQLKELDCDFAYATTGEQALERIAATLPQLILMDVMMPGISGFQTVETLSQNPATRTIPVIFLTARAESDDVVRGFSLGGVDYVTKPFKGVELRSRVRNHLELHAYRTNLERLVEERTQEAELLKDVIIEAMGELSEYRDPETGSHIHRTRAYVVLLAETLVQQGRFLSHLTEDYVVLLGKSAPLHDIGKVAIRDSILLKPGKLTVEEFDEMKKHTLYGEEVIANLEHMAGQPTSFLNCAKEIAGSHHEKFNGSGYPRGLVGDAIPLAGRIMAIADVYDALISKRVYKSSMTHDEAMGIMLEGKGSHFDPVLIDAFVSVELKFREIAAANAD
ncbi:MAG: response regulator [Desulfobulbus sp.]|jgi:putative two-component system response regulator|uniref:HD domain-containing phosphohydrolase n=1 Tax=Desulfobulbus sp. TaxID=895 RepID=UPI00284B6166|nr:HD domain-containing phosphohydrolase [Desulfobulbus sp.]MDR2550951.1 response regulator [Desulfobulbus sp.]